MARMMGTQQELDLLTSLLFTVTNEAQYKERVTKLHEMTVVHRAALDAAVKAKGEAEAAVRNADATMADRSQQALAAESKAKDAMSALESSKAAFDTRIKRANDDLSAARTAHAAKVAQETTQLHTAQAVHAELVRNHLTEADQHRQQVASATQDLLKREQGIASREAYLSRQEALHKEREDKIATAEADLTQRVNKMRSLAAG